MPVDLIEKLGRAGYDFYLSRKRPKDEGWDNLFTSEYHPPSTFTVHDEHDYTRPFQGGEDTSQKSGKH